MRSPDTVEQLRAELRQDLDFIERNYHKNREMTARAQQSDHEDEFLYAALGYTIHNLYNAIESYFYRIAKFFENEIGRFRHLFRNLYKSPLIPAKVRFANDAASGVDDSIRQSHERFDSFLRELKRELES